MKPALTDPLAKISRLLTESDLKSHPLTKADLGAVLNNVLVIHEDLECLLKEGEVALRNGGPDDRYVWQRDFTSIFSEFERLLGGLATLDGFLEDIYLAEDNRYGEAANEAREATGEPPRKARVEYAISDLEFLTDPESEEDEIAYLRRTVEEWLREAKKWSVHSVRTIRAKTHS